MTLIPKTECEQCEKALTPAEQRENIKICKQAPIPLWAAWSGLRWVCAECVEMGP